MAPSASSNRYGIPRLSQPLQVISDSITAYENASRQAKLRAEIAQATRENKTYIRNVERAKMVENMESSKKRKRREAAEASPTEGSAAQPEQVEIRRQFRQHKAKGKRAEDGGAERESSEKVKRLLSKVF
jgi:ESF2/ABP1 family protein